MRNFSNLESNKKKEERKIIFISHFPNMNAERKSYVILCFSPEFNELVDFSFIETKIFPLCTYKQHAQYSRELQSLSEIAR